MILGKRSNYMLKYEKSKSKLVEFEIARENYPNFPLDSDDLTYTTLFVLSRFCEEFLINPSSLKALELKSELTTVSQYFDATIKTRHRQNYNNLFLLLGATSYFLSDNFGSAKVLINQIDNWTIIDDVPTLLYTTLLYLLKENWIDVPSQKIEYRSYQASFKRHFEAGKSHEIIIAVLRKMHYNIHQEADMLAVSFIDFLFSVVICAIDHSAWILLPEHSNATAEQWAEYLARPKSLKLLWPAQKLILHAGVLRGQDIVVPLPTGVGKTKSIEILIRSKFMDSGTSVAVIIAPLRALCNEITVELTAALANEAVINQFTDTMQIDFDLDLLFNAKSVFIFTPEKFSYILRHQPDFLEEINLFVFDEAHLFDDVSRGAPYELLVSEISRSRKNSAQMVLFSAVLANATQISEWLFNDPTAIIDYSQLRSTEKSIGFISSDFTLHYYEKDDMEEEGYYVPKSITASQLLLKGRERNRRSFPEKKAQDIAIYYAIKLCNQGGTAIYAGQVRSILPIMRRIIEIDDRGYNMSNLIASGCKYEIERLSALIALHYGDNYELSQVSRLGVFPHYADLPNGVKMAVEHALRKNHISFVVCTTTLAEGVNIPIKYLFLSTISQGASNVQIRKMQNMVGRTARSGIYTEGSAIITDPSFYDNRLDWRGGAKYKWADCKKMFDYNNTEACSSTILLLVSKMVIDYNCIYKSTALYSYLIENYGAPDCFTSLKEIIKSGYKDRIENDERYLRYSSNIDIRVAELEHVLESIENYLCYLYDSQRNSEQYLSMVDTLVTNTFAYFLGDADEREALLTLFRKVAQRVLSEIDSEKVAYFARSLYGIETSRRILSWIDENIGWLEDSTLSQAVNAIAKFFFELFPDRVNINFDVFLAILQYWMEGVPYVAISSNIREQLSMNQIEKLCSSTFSYHLCFLIGNILDAIGDRSEELVEMLSFAQKRIKYGVPSFLQILICENLFDDRIIAQQLEAINGVEISSENELKEHMIADQKKVLHLLESYPDYFRYKFLLYIKQS